mmetsp:Transcript_10757/g.16663  ORF Transcript_10757/g.16663 Transcript_10757/m.16663 type:complete len:216 (+) Transcript_10757:206-853(+)
MKRSPLGEITICLHVWMGKVCPNCSNSDNEVWTSQELFVIILRKLLTALQDGLEGHDACPLLYPAEGVPVALLQAAVPVPAGEEVVGHQTGRGHAHEARADPEGVCEAPQPLADGLRVPRDPGHARLPQVLLRPVHRGDLQQVEGGGVQEQEADEGERPAEAVHAGEVPQAPQQGAVVAVVDEVDHGREGQGQGGEGEEDAPGPGANNRLPLGTE